MNCELFFTQHRHHHSSQTHKSSLDQLLVELIYVIANIYAKKQEYVSSINVNEIKAKMLLCTYTFEEKLCWEQWGYFNQKTFRSHKVKIYNFWSRPTSLVHTSWMWAQNISFVLWIEIKKKISNICLERSYFADKCSLKKVTFKGYWL